MTNLPNPFSSLPTTTEPIPATVEPSIICSRCGRNRCACSNRNQYAFDPEDFIRRFKTLTAEQIDEINRREDLIPMLILMPPEQDYRESPEKPVQRPLNGRPYPRVAG